MPPARGSRAERVPARVHAPSDDDARHLLGGFAHDVRSIAAAAEGLAFRAGGRVEDARAAAYVEAIRESMQRLVSISAAALELAKDPTARAHTAEPVALGTLCDVVAATLIEQSASHEVDLEVRRDTELHVRGDRGELYRMVLNLAQNAIVHGSRGGGRVVLAVAPRASGRNGAELVVDDEGRGFPQAMLGEGPRAPVWRGGHGLGLAIAWTIASRHGARLAVENRGEGGGRVRVTFEEVP